MTITEIFLMNEQVEKKIEILLRMQQIVNKHSPENFQAAM
jgi:hypothetical protein